MALKIIKASDPIKVERLNLCIYAPPGVGKSTLGFSAESPLMLDFDRGAYRALGRKDSVAIDRWEEVAGMNADDWKPYKTCIVDTAGRALDKLGIKIVADNPKMGNGTGSLGLKGFGELKTRFSSFVKLLNSFGVDVVQICHMDEQRNGDDLIERLDAQGSSKNEIYKSADAMGRIFIRQGKRFLDFSPREGSFGKNPGQLPELEIPEHAVNPNFLAEVIKRIKTKLNEMTEEQRLAQEVLEQWIACVNDLGRPEDFTSMLDKMPNAPEAARELFKKRASDLGFKFNKKQNMFYEAEAVRASA